MSNVFGPSAGISPTQAYALVDQRPILAARNSFRRRYIPELELANSLYVASGKWPARGWILLRRQDYDKIPKYSTSLRLQIDSLDVRLPSITFGQLAIVQAQCVTRGISTDPNAVYLVEITDRRGTLWNRWFQFPTNSAYNVRAPAYPQRFYSPSTNVGVAWTWNIMIGNLWGQMPALGPYPGLPFVPDGTPENWWYPGMSLWESLTEVLDLLGCVVSVDLTQANPYGIVQGGAADAAFTTKQTAAIPFLEDDLEWIDTGSGRVPGTIIVYFHRRNDQYGTEETIRRDTLQWSMTPLYQVAVPAPAAFTGATGTHYIWSDFTIRYDVDNNPLAADVATAAVVAADEVTQYFGRVYRGTAGFMTQVYGGAIPFATGSLVDGVRWYQDYSQGRGGWRTEIIRGNDPPWAILEQQPE